MRKKVEINLNGLYQILFGRKLKLKVSGVIYKKAYVDEPLTRKNFEFSSFGIV